MKSRISDLDGTNRTPFQARSLAPVENRVGRRDKFTYSQQRFATPRKQVVEKLNRWLAG